MGKIPRSKTGTVLGYFNVHVGPRRPGLSVHPRRDVRGRLLFAAPRMECGARKHGRIARRRRVTFTGRVRSSFSTQVALSAILLSGTALLTRAVDHVRRNGLELFLEGLGTANP